MTLNYEVKGETFDIICPGCGSHAVELDVNNEIVTTYCPDCKCVKRF